MGVIFFERVPGPENEKLFTSEGRFGNGMKGKVNYENTYRGTILEIPWNFQYHFSFPEWYWKLF